MKKWILQPQHVAWIIGLLFTGIFVLIFPWLQSVFRGDVILNQNLVSVKLDYLDIFGLKIPFSDFTIRFYSIFMLFAFFGGYLLSMFLIRRSFLPDSLLDRLIIGIVLFGLIGARLFFVLFNIPSFFGNVTDVNSFFQSLGSTFLVYEGGLAISGGILACVAYLYWFTRRHKFNFFEVTDMLVPGVLLGQVIGRWGNFFNYEAYGGPTNVFWKMFVPENAVNGNKYQFGQDMARYFHPTFLYEMIPNLILLLFLLLRYNKLTARSAGLVTAFYLIGYGTIRTITEFFRLDALKIPVNLSLNFPTWIAQPIGSLFPTGIKEPLIYWLEHFRIDGIMVSQIVAIGFVAAGIWIYNQRSGVIYSPAQQSDLN